MAHESGVPENLKIACGSNRGRSGFHQASIARAAASRARQVLRALQPPRDRVERRVALPATGGLNRRIIAVGADSRPVRSGGRRTYSLTDHDYLVVEVA